MIQYLSSYIVTDHELTKVSDDIRSVVGQYLDGKDRLHNFLQLYEIAKTITEQLEAFDKTGFLALIHEELKNVCDNLNEQLSVKANMHQEKLTLILSDATAMEEDLRKRKECIESVLKAMQKLEDYRPTIDDIRQKMDALERNIQELQKIRQSAPFIEMCKFTTNES